MHLLQFTGVNKNRIFIDFHRVIAITEISAETAAFLLNDPTLLHGYTSIYVGNREILVKESLKTVLGAWSSMPAQSVLDTDARINQSLAESEIDIAQASVPFDAQLRYSRHRASPS
jgi:hypothetical protein